MFSIDFVYKENQFNVSYIGSAWTEGTADGFTDL